MDEKEQQVVDRIIAALDTVIVELMAQRNELDEKISNLRTIKEAVTRLLPPEKRLEKLFH